MSSISDEAREARLRLEAMASGNGAAPGITLPAYPLDVWPEPLAHYFDQYAKMVGAPVGMIANPATSILSGVIGNSRPVIVKEGYRVAPAIWTFDLAEPGTGKSPMLKGARNLVSSLQRDAKDTAEWLMEEYIETVAARERNDHSPMPPRPEEAQTYFTDSATIEKIGDICETSAGMCMIRDELIGWLYDLNVYRGGRGSDRQAWQTFWSGQENTSVHRKSSNVVMPANPVVAICGGIQPGLFPQLAKDAIEDGMLARFLGSVYPDVVIEFNLTRLEEGTLAAARELTAQLRKRPAARPVQFSRRCLSLLHEWDQNNKPARQAAVGAVRNFLSKLVDQVVKLAALLHCVHDPHAVADGVSQERLEDAMSLMDYYRHHTLYAYHYLNILSADIPAGERITAMAAIRRAGGSATRTEIQRGTGGHWNRDMMTSVLEALLDVGWVERSIISREETGGKQAEVYTITEKGKLRF